MPTSSLSPHFFALLAVSLLTALVARYTFPDTLSMEPSTTTFLDALRARRSYYALTADPVIPDTRLIEVIQECILHTPSGMNSQTTTVVVLLHEQHHKLWDLTLDTMRAQVRAQAFGPLEKKLLGVRAGYGTVLFFEDETKIDALKKKVPHLAGRFPINAEHANAMAQLVIWTALEMEGFGASLHHFNPAIDERVAAEWNVPKNLVLKAQLAFGKSSETLVPKEFDPVEDRVKVYGAQL